MNFHMSHFIKSFHVISYVPGVAEYTSRQGKAGTAPGGNRRREPVTVQQMLGPTDALVCPLLSRPHPTMGTLVSRGGVRTSVGQNDDVPNHFWRLQKDSFHVNGGRPAQLRVSNVNVCMEKRYK